MSGDQEVDALFDGAEVISKPAAELTGHLLDDAAKGLLDVLPAGADLKTLRFTLQEYRKDPKINRVCVMYKIDEGNNLSLVIEKMKSLLEKK